MFLHVFYTKNLKISKIPIFFVWIMNTSSILYINILDINTSSILFIQEEDHVEFGSGQGGIFLRIRSLSKT